MVRRGSWSVVPLSVFSFVSSRSSIVYCNRILRRMICTDFTQKRSKRCAMRERVVRLAREADDRCVGAHGLFAKRSCGRNDEIAKDVDLEGFADDGVDDGAVELA